MRCLRVGLRAVAASRLGVAGMLGVRDAYAWGYVLSPLRGLRQRELRDGRAAMPSFPGSAGERTALEAPPPESVTNPSDVRSSERPVFRAALYAMLTRGATCCRRFAAWCWGCREYPTLTRGATSCRRFAAWWGGDAGSTPRLRVGLRAVAASRLGDGDAGSTPRLRVGLRAVAASRLGDGDAGSTPRLRVGLRAVAASRLGGAVMPGVPHAYAWGYILSPLRGLN